MAFNGAGDLFAEGRINSAELLQRGNSLARKQGRGAPGGTSHFFVAFLCRLPNR
jgi:hypothetical protein